MHSDKVGESSGTENRNSNDQVNMQNENLDNVNNLNGPHSSSSAVNGTQSNTRQSTGEYEYSELPVALIATNVDEVVFADDEERTNFEDICSEYGENVTFHYLPSFRRIRITYQSPEEAVRARTALHSREIHGKTVSFYFAQTKIFKNPSLEPPEPKKQFLISPPASPPIGWEPVPESEPIIDYDLLAALANLAPGETHELHPADGNKPSIVVEPCEDPLPNPNKQKIQQTKRPDPR